jgi:hypothetical protein
MREAAGMNEPKPFASLSPGLLARKGGARPAMRPQLAPMNFQPSSSSAAVQIEDDLGWNDMGDTELEAPIHAAQPLGLSPLGEAPSPSDFVSPVEFAAPVNFQAPDEYDESEEFEASEENDGSGQFEASVEDEAPVQAQILQLKPHVLAAMAERPEVLRQQEEVAERITAPPRKRGGRRSALSEGRRAAFTLRLDHERHLQLRLACTLTGRSAQQLVTDALDRLISELPDVAAMAATVGTGRK